MASIASGVNSVTVFAVFRGEFVQERFREERNVDEAFAQGRQHDFDDAQAEEKVFAEFAGFDFIVRDCGLSRR